MRLALAYQSTAVASYHPAGFIDIGRRL